MTNFYILLLLILLILSLIIFNIYTHKKEYSLKYCFNIFLKMKYLRPFFYSFNDYDSYFYFARSVLKYPDNKYYSIQYLNTYSPNAYTLANLIVVDYFRFNYIHKDNYKDLLQAFLFLKRNVEKNQYTSFFDMSTSVFRTISYLLSEVKILEDLNSTLKYYKNYSEENYYFYEGQTKWNVQHYT